MTNPAARRSKPHLTRWVADALSRVAKVSVETTTHRGHASDLASAAAADGYDVVVAMGGDGTVNEVLQGVAQTDTRLAVLPSGSTNVYARILGMPTSLTGATAILREAITTDRTRHVGAGTANGRWFAWCAGFGYDAEVVREVEEHPRMKRHLGQASFLIHGWRVRQAAQQARITIQAGPARPAHRQQKQPPRAEVGGAAVVCAADPYTYLGPFAARLCPEATLERGLDCTALSDLELTTLTQVMRKALGGRDVRDLPQVRGWHDRAWDELEANAEVDLHVDGDPIGRSRRLRVEHHPGAVRLIA